MNKQVKQPPSGISDRSPDRWVKPARNGAAGGARRFESADIFAGAQEVIIDHDGDHYRLRCTSKGKLILTK